MKLCLVPFYSSSPQCSPGEIECSVLWCPPGALLGIVRKENRSRGHVERLEMCGLLGDHGRGLSPLLKPDLDGLAWLVFTAAALWLVLPCPPRSSTVTLGIIIPRSYSCATPCLLV